MTSLATVPEASSANKAFNLLRVCELFQQSMQEPNVNLKLYIAAYRELARALPQLGCIFHFVVYDIEEKLHVLEHVHSESPSSDNDHTSVVHYESAETMLNFEKSHGLLYKKHFYSGSRALFVLNRALRFLVRFIGDLRECSKHDKVATIAHRAYDETLGSKVHSWWVVKAVHLAVYTLPSRQTLLQTIGGHLSPEEQDVQMSAAIEIGQRVYALVHGMFEQRNMLDIDPKSSLF